MLCKLWIKKNICVINLLKYKSRKFSMKLLKELSQRSKQQMTDLEKILKLLKFTMNFVENADYLSSNGELANLHEKKVLTI